MGQRGSSKCCKHVIMWLLKMSTCAGCVIRSPGEGVCSAVVKWDRGGARNAVSMWSHGCWKCTSKSLPALDMLLRSSSEGREVQWRGRLGSHDYDVWQGASKYMAHWNNPANLPRCVGPELNAGMLINVCMCLPVSSSNSLCVCGVRMCVCVCVLDMWACVHVCICVIVEVCEMLKFVKCWVFSD